MYWLSAFRLFWCFSQSYDLLFGLREEKSLFVYGCFFILNHMIFSLVSGRRRGKLWRRKSTQRRYFILFLIFFSHIFPLLTKSYFLFPYSLLSPASLDCPSPLSSFPPLSPNSFPRCGFTHEHANSCGPSSTGLWPQRRNRKEKLAQTTKHNKPRHINQTTIKAVASPKELLFRDFISTGQ